ncbi:MAG: hypothetical protein PWP14_2409 [Methanolobus sp.]|jgi:hypothetical protein|nr:hypothetical protein [Methanolobus sp.]MDN5311015.1 hypothetical protein [Methanolobus sp.]
MGHLVQNEPFEVVLTGGFEAIDQYVKKRVCHEQPGITEGS